MARALQNLMHKNQRKVRYTQRKSALLMALANEDHKAISVIIKKWLGAASPKQTKTN